MDGCGHETTTDVFCLGIESMAIVGIHTQRDAHPDHTVWQLEVTW